MNLIVPDWVVLGALALAVLVIWVLLWVWPLSRQIDDFLDRRPGHRSGVVCRYPADCEICRSNLVEELRSLNDQTPNKET